jgi:hypothetical protein
MSLETMPAAGGRAGVFRRMAWWFVAGSMVLWAGWSLAAGSIILFAALMYMSVDGHVSTLIGILPYLPLLPGFLPGEFAGHMQVHGGPGDINDNINYLVVYTSDVFFWLAVAYLLLRWRRKK